MPGAKRVYFDACIFIAWLTNEERSDPADQDGIAYVIEQWERSAIVVVTSTITRIEVLECKFTPEQESRFKALLGRSTIVTQGVTSPIADLAQEIRSYYLDAQGVGSKIQTPDAIHLATAVAQECEAFLTFDGLRDKPKKPRGLLALPAPLAGKYEITIEPPRRPPPPPPPPAPPPNPQGKLWDERLLAPPPGKRAIEP